MSGGDYFSRNGEELPFLARDIFISWLGKRREEGDGREIVGYEYVLQVFKSASSRSREENSLCMQSRDGEEHPDAAEVWFLTKEGAFYRLNTIKITDGGVQWSKSRCRKRGGKKKKKRKSVVWKAEWQFSKDKGTREVPREQWNRFYFPMISATLFGFLRPFWSTRPFPGHVSTRSVEHFRGEVFFFFNQISSKFLLHFSRNNGRVGKIGNDYSSCMKSRTMTRFELEKRFNFEESFGFCCFTIYWESD